MTPEEYPKCATSKGIKCQLKQENCLGSWLSGEEGREVWSEQ